MTTPMNDNGPSQSQASTAQPSPLRGMLRPEQIPNFPFLDAAKKTQYADGVKKLWAAIQSKPPEDESHQSALKKLREITSSMGQQMRHWQARKVAQRDGESGDAEQSTQRPGAQRPVSQGQSQPQQQLPPQQPTQSQLQPPQALSVQNQQTPELPPLIKQRVESMQWYLPPHIQEGPEAEMFRSEIKKRYGQSLYGFETAAGNLSRLEEWVKKHISEGAQPTAEMMENRKRLQDQVNTHKTFIGQVMRQQKTNQQMTQNANANIPNLSAAQQIPPANIGQQGGLLVQNPVSQAPSGAMQNNRQQAPAAGSMNQTAQNAMQQSPINQAQPLPPHSPPPQNFPAPRPLPHPAQPTPFTHTQQQSPQSATAPNSVPQGVVPYTHQGAIAAAARSYSNPVPQQITPSSSSMGSVGNGQSFNKPETDKKTNPSFPIPKTNWTPQAAVPVSMGTSRPTMAGSDHGPSGMIGQPAIQKQPTFLLQGRGDRVLDKKKLDELVRQVTGNSEEVLHPEVEESVLQLADEFVENVVRSACRLAKLRGSTQLDLRDIQLILERQYNIRIPGYATDEVRTVRKIQPTTGYLQKMNAVQAAKVMGGSKTDT